MHQEFLEQLKPSPEGWYETALPWNGDHPLLPTDKTGSLKRLASLVQRLKWNGKLEDYDAITQQQLKEGVIEEAEEPTQVIEFYLPHKAVIRESSEKTKVRIVYAPVPEPMMPLPLQMSAWNRDPRRKISYGKC